MQRTCDYHYNRRMCEHEAACNEAEMCVIKMMHDEEAAYQQELQDDKRVGKGQ